MNSLRPYLYLNAGWSFSQTYIFHLEGKMYGVHIPRKYIESWHFSSCHYLGIFLHATTLSPNLNYPPSSYLHTLSRNKLIMPLGSVFFKYFTQTHVEADETMVCFIRIKSENMKMTSNIRLFRFCMICSFFQIWWLYSFVYNACHVLCF